MNQGTTIDPEARLDPREWVQAAILMIDDGFQVSEAAKAVGCSRSRLSEALHGAVRCRCGRALTSHRREEPVCKACESEHARRNDAEIIRLWQQGLRSNEIAARLSDMTPQNVRGRVGNIRLNQGIDLARRR